MTSPFAPQPNIPFIELDRNTVLELLELAEEAAYHYESGIALSAVQLINQLSSPKTDLTASRATQELTTRLVHLLHHHCIESPDDTRFTRTSLRKAHNDAYADTPATRDAVNLAIQKLFRHYAIQPDTAHYEPKNIRYFRVSSPAHLQALIEPSHSPTNAAPPPELPPALLRKALHQYAQDMASQNRHYETMFLMAAAFILRDPATHPSKPPPLLSLAELLAGHDCQDELQPPNQSAPPPPGETHDPDE